MKVIVTGGAGFVGSHVVDLLIKNGYEVVVIDNLSHGKIDNINKKAKFYKMDIRDREIDNIFDSEKPDYVIHEAAQMNVSRSLEDPLGDAEINIMGSINLLESCKKHNVKKIVYPSSAAVFGEPKYLPIDEEHPLNMVSNYGISKHTVEHYLDVYNKLFNLKYVSLRCSNVYGPRQDTEGEGGVIATFCNNVLKDEDIFIFGDGNQVRDFIYVEDVAKATVLCMENDLTGIFNICSNLKITINDIVSIIERIADKKINPIYCSSRKGDIKESWMSNEKILSKSNWNPVVNIDNGIKKNLEYILINSNLIYKGEIK